MKITIELNEYQERNVKQFAKKMKNKSLEETILMLINMGLSESVW